MCAPDRLLKRSWRPGAVTLAPQGSLCLRRLQPTAELPFPPCIPKHPLGAGPGLSGRSCGRASTSTSPPCPAAKGTSSLSSGAFSLPGSVPLGPADRQARGGGGGAAGACTAWLSGDLCLLFLSPAPTQPPPGGSLLLRKGSGCFSASFPLFSPLRGNSDHYGAGHSIKATSEYSFSILLSQTASLSRREPC